MRIDNTYNLGSIMEHPYVRHLAIADHVRELNIIDAELRREKNHGNNPEDIAAIERHFQNELADLVLIALKDLPPELLEERQARFLEKEEQAQD